MGSSTDSGAPLCFALGLHNHQPLGNFEEAFRANYQRAYLPTLRLLSRHPNVRVTLHYSGILLEWLEAHGAEAMELLHGLVDRGQVELQTGGYYEPIFAVIPEEDRKGQILKLTAYLLKVFGVEPRGLWLAERVWEPSLAKSFAEAGVDYLVLDDAHFEAAGLQPGRLRGYYVTEDGGWALKVFPTRKSLRYAVPFEPPEEAARLVAQTARRSGGLAVLHDDGEKFGGWPGTFRTVHEGGWLDRFFSSLDAEGVWTLTLSEALEAFPPSGRVYLPCASYQEMMEWSGGFWRNYLVKYPEANNLHKKMLWVSRKVSDSGSEPARERLWRGQCNDAYWHGVFGGLYLTHLRSALYRELIAAENLADKNLKGGGPWWEVREEDFDCDGRPEILISGGEMNAYLDPDDGGTLFELDYRPLAFNLIDTLARRPEAYHREILAAPREEKRLEETAKTIHERRFRGQKDLESLLRYDRHRRSCLRDLFFEADPAESGSGPEDVGELSLAVYQSSVVSQDPPTVALSAVGSTGGSSGGRVKVEKTIIALPGRLEVHYRLESREETRRMDFRFGVEFNLNFLGAADPERAYFANGEPPEGGLLGTAGQWRRASEFGIRDRRLDLEARLACEPEADVWRYPVETVSQSERAYDRIYQASCLVPWWTVSLGPGETWEAGLALRLSRLQPALESASPGGAETRSPGMGSPRETAETRG